MRPIYTKIDRIIGSVVELDNVTTPIPYESLAIITGADGRKSLGQVIKLKESTVSLQVFSGTAGLSTDSEVHFLGHPMQIGISEDILGRVFNGAGVAIDKGAQLTEHFVEVGGPSINPASRRIPDKMVHTGIPMIDVFNTLVFSQKIPVFSVSGEPYNELVARIAMQAEADIIVLGGIGLTHREASFFRTTLEESGAFGRSVLFLHEASDPVIEGISIPDLALTVSEQFALQGKNVLVLLSDMTNFANSLKEVAITMEQIPAVRGYPGSLYTDLARRYERAVDFHGAGSVTIVSVTTMPGDDVTHPIPDNTGYITEGQLYLKNNQIDPFGSLSRLKQQVNGKTRPDHRPIMDGMLRLYAKAKSAQDKRSMGFTLSEWDKKLLKYATLFEVRMMDWKTNIPLFEALDLGWEILAMCFTPEETEFPTAIINDYWPKGK